MIEVKAAGPGTPAERSLAACLARARNVLGHRRPRQRTHAHRRRGIDLNALVGRRFTIGELELIGRRRCEPCAHLQRLTRPGVLRALVGRGGLRADLLNTGTLRIGDPINPTEDHE